MEDQLHSNLDDRNYHLPQFYLTGLKDTPTHMVDKDQKPGQGVTWLSILVSIGIKMFGLIHVQIQGENDFKSLILIILFVRSKINLTHLFRNLPFSLC